MTSLTVSESKRLIAKGIVRAGCVRHAMEHGILAVASGTTNGYIIEELLDKPFDKKHCVTGRTLPSRYAGPKIDASSAGLIIRKGEKTIANATDAIGEMGPGDVFIKGVNALNYEREQAGILIGHPTGGTVGAMLGTAVSRRICCLQPVGLEKSTPADLDEVARMINQDPDGKGPTLFVFPGTIFTEIEALEVLADVVAIPAGAGGIGGAEGAVWLALFGDTGQLEKAEEVLASVRGEAPFIES
jgi:hypothetical protein